MQVFLWGAEEREEAVMFQLARSQSCDLAALRKGLMEVVPQKDKDIIQVRPHLVTILVQINKDPIIIVNIINIIINIIIIFATFNIITIIILSSLLLPSPLPSSSSL